MLGIKSGSVLFGIFVLGCIVVAEAGKCREPPVMIQPTDCCEFPGLDEEKAIVADCVGKFGAQTARLMADKTPGPPRGCCLAECIFNATGHADLTDDGLFDEKLKAAEAKGMAAEWTPILKDAEKICREEAKNHMADFEAGMKLPPLDPNDKVCHPKYGFAMMCSMKNLMANCPAKFFKDTPECKQIQEFSKTCEL